MRARVIIAARRILHVTDPGDVAHSAAIVAPPISPRHVRERISA
jgi:hypothetical protein